MVVGIDAGRPYFIIRGCWNKVEHSRHDLPFQVTMQERPVATLSFRRRQVNQYKADMCIWAWGNEGLCALRDAER